MIIATAVLLVAVVVVAIVLSGGSSPKPTSPSTGPSTGPAAFTDALKTTLKSPTISGSLTLSVTSGKASYTVTGTGGWNTAEHAGQFTENLSGSKQLASAGPLTELFVGKTLYLKLGPSLSAFVHTPWLSTPLKGSSALQGVSPFKVPSGTTKVAAQLPAIISSLPSVLRVKNLGSATVDGAVVTEYESTFNTASVLSSLQSQFPTEFQGLTAPKTAANVTIKAAVDRQGHLRRLTVNASTTSGKAATVSFTVDITSFDASLHFTAPPSNQVTPLAQLLGGNTFG